MAVSVFGLMAAMLGIPVPVLSTIGKPANLFPIPLDMKKPFSRCGYRGCRTLVKTGQRCAEHSQSDLQDARTRLQSSKLYGWRWTKLRKAWLVSEPFCRSCGAAADTVDHVIPHRGDVAIFWDQENLQSLCKACHDRITRQEIIWRRAGLSDPEIGRRKGATI